MKKIAINNLIKWGLIVSTISIIGCSVKRDFRNKTTSTKVKLNTLDLSLNYHVKQGNYIISIHDSIGKRLTEKFIFLQDSFAFKMDTIDLNLTNPYWTKSRVERVLRNCIENNEVKIYSSKQSQYIDRIKRTVSKSKFKDIHTYYVYTNLLYGDTILYSFSFDTGTPPF